MGRPYSALFLAVSVHFFVMWALTYVGVYAFDHIYANVNRLYMAIVMVAPMPAIMLAFMWGMFPDRRANLGILGVAALVFVLAFAAIRAQVLVGDEQLMESMIPHHSIAIKNCLQSDLDDPEVVQLCDEIVRAQREEIAIMEDILGRSY